MDTSIRIAMGTIATALAIAAAAAPARAQFTAPPAAEPVVVDATNVLAQSMGMTGNGIPRALLADAHAIAIVPGMVRGAFVVGLQHGRGVLLLRDGQGGWQPPRMIQITGGSVGYQIGVQSTDLILVFRTQQSVANLLSRTIKIGVDASAAAGPVGRSASAATDLPLKSEILSYSRARGAFVGVSIDGSSISLDPAAEAGYYVQPGTIPASAMQLMQTVAAYSSVAPAAAAASDQAPPATNSALAAPPQPPGELEAARQQLDAASRQLVMILDDSWKRYLALPADVYVPNQNPNPQWIQQAVARYEDIARRPEYAALHTRPEFQETRRCLHRVRDLQQAGVQPLPLPPPPSGQAAR
jgi:lipid-binding SYLF domain-containing protein